ncbi:MAG: hypothetical protein R3B06_12050 [Kofleriaceae bacterium]
MAKISSGSAGAAAGAVGEIGTNNTGPTAGAAGASVGAAGVGVDSAAGARLAGVIQPNHDAAVTPTASVVAATATVKEVEGRSVFGRSLDIGSWGS